MQRFYDVDVDIASSWSNDIFEENFYDTKCLTGDVVILGGIQIDDNRWLQWQAVDGALLLNEVSKVQPLQDTSVCLRFDSLPLQIACFVNRNSNGYNATLIIATVTSIITMTMHGDAVTSLLAAVVDFNQGSTIILHAPGYTHDYSHFLHLFAVNIDAPVAADISLSTVLYSTSSGDLIRCSVEYNILECRSMRETGISSLYGLLNSAAPALIAMTNLSAAMITVNAIGQVSLPNNGTLSLAQIWGVSAKDAWVNNVTLTPADVMLRVNAREEIALLGVRLTYRGQMQWKCVQINLSSSAITPLTLPFSEASLLDIRLHNTSINSLWHASSVFLVVHSSPTAFVVHKTRNEYCQATRREDETLFRCIASGGISDITSAKMLWCRRLMLPHRFTDNAFHPSQLNTCNSISSLNETCLELMTQMTEMEDALPLKMVNVGDKIVVIRPGGASVVLRVTLSFDDAVLNMTVPLSETLLELDNVIVQALGSKYVFDETAAGRLLKWCRDKVTSSAFDLSAVLGQLSTLPDVSHFPIPLRSQLLRHIVHLYYDVAKVACLYAASTPYALQSLSTMLYYFFLLQLGELRTNSRLQMKDVEHSDLLLVDVSLCSAPKDASPLWDEIISNTTEYHSFSPHNSIVAYLAKYGPYSILTCILSLFKLTQTPLSPPLSSSYQQHVSLLNSYFDRNFILKSSHIAMFQIAAISNSGIDVAASQLQEEVACPVLEEHGEPARSVVDGEIATIICEDIVHWYDNQTSRSAMYRTLLKLAHQPLFQEYYASFYHTTSTLQYMITYTPNLILQCATVYYKLNALFLLHRCASRVSNLYALENCYGLLAYLDAIHMHSTAMVELYATVHSHIVTYCLENNNYNNCWASISALIDLNREHAVDNNWKMLLKSFLHQICKHNVAWLCSLHADPAGLPAYLHSIISDELEKLAHSLDIPRCVLYYDSLVAYWISCEEYRDVARVMYQLVGRLHTDEHAELIKRCLITATTALSLLPQAQQFIVLRQHDVSIENQQRQLQAVQLSDLQYQYIAQLCREQCNVYYDQDVDVMQQLCSGGHFVLALQLQAVSKQEDDCKRVLIHHLSRYMLASDTAPVQQFLSVIPAGVLFRCNESDYSNVHSIIVHLLKSKSYRYDCVAEVFAVTINCPTHNKLSSELVQLFCGVKDGEAKYCGSNLQVLLLLLLKAGRLAEACSIATTLMYSVPVHQHNTLPFHLFDQILVTATSLQSTDEETKEVKVAADALKAAVKNYFARLCLVESYDTATA